jgi:hypothetical protein
VQILTNAIYFKGQWEKEFEKKATKDEDWHGPKSCKVSMMQQFGGYLYYEGDGFQALDLPYKGGQLSMHAECLEFHCGGSSVGVEEPPEIERTGFSFKYIANTTAKISWTYMA